VPLNDCIDGRCMLYNECRRKRDGRTVPDHRKKKLNMPIGGFPRRSQDGNWSARIFFLQLYDRGRSCSASLVTARRSSKALERFDMIFAESVTKLTKSAITSRESRSHAPTRKPISIVLLKEGTVPVGTATCRGASESLNPLRGEI
jgi:hypothetical protein